MPDRATLPDVSYYCSNIDFQKMKSHGAPGVILRASWGITKDSRHDEYRLGAKAADLPILQYHYLDWRWDVLQQADVFSKIITTGATASKVFPICDLEMDPVPYNYKADANIKLIDLMPETRKDIGVTVKPDRYNHHPGVYSMNSSQVQTSVEKFINRVEANTGTILAIYSGYYYWVQWMSPDPSWLKYPFWLAWWSAEQYVKVPPPFISWWMWQYTGHGVGAEWGQESKDADLNLYNDTAEAFRQKYYAYTSQPPTPPTPPPPAHTIHKCITCGIEWPVTPPPTPPPTLYPKYKVMPLHNLNVRSGPGAQYPKVSDNLLLAGAEVYVDTFIPGAYSHIQPTTLFPSGGWIFSDYIVRV
jgi:GH25 family lysozyme M1 (1,4-beta-N-acetylmuramidase)